MLRQTSSNWQCIVIDDCGGENAELLVQGYRSDKVTYVNNGKTVGLSANWNRAIELAETPLLTILHADDVMGENYVMNTINAFAQHPEVAAVNCRVQLIDEKNNPVTTFVHKSKNMLKPRGARGDLLLCSDKGLRTITLADWIICPTLTYRTSVVKGIPFNCNLKFASDLEFLARLFFADHSIFSRKEIDYFYRIHENSQTAKMKSDGLRFLEEWAVISWIGRVGKLKKWNRTRILASIKPILRAHILYEALKSLQKFRFKTAIKLIFWAIYQPPKDKLHLFDLN